MKKNLFGEDLPKKEEMTLFPVIKKGTKKLTTAQQEFNRLNKKIAKMRKDLLLLPDRKRKVEAFYEEFLFPLECEYDRIFGELLLYLDKIYDEKELSTPDQYLLSAFILYKCAMLDIWVVGFNEELFDKLVNVEKKHDMIQSRLTEEELEKEKIQELINSFEMLTGYKATGKMKKAKTEEELSELIDEFLTKKSRKKNAEDAFSNDSSWEEDTSKKSSRRKMTQAELKRKLKEEEAMKSMRSIYMSLAKTLHPDLEADPAERALKEDRMKQLTEAYRNKDLAKLLSMQIAWLEEDKCGDLSLESNEIIKEYNKMLRKQLADLEKEKKMAVYMGTFLSDELCDLLLSSPSDTKLKAELDLYLQFKQSKMEQFKHECKSVQTKQGVNLLIREYERMAMMEAFWDGQLLDALNSIRMK